MSQEQYNNLAASTTTGSINNSSDPVTFSVQTGDGALFPATTNGSFRVTVSDADGSNAEVMLCTSRSGDSLTCSRASNATGEVPTPVKVTHGSGSVVSGDLTVGAFNAVRAEIGNSGADLSIPTVLRKGDLYFPNNGCSIYRGDGSAFSSWGPAMPFNVPVDANFSWMNQNPSGGTTSVDAQNGFITLIQTGNSAGDISGRVKNVIASKSFTLTIAVLGCANMVSTASDWGLVLWNGNSSGAAIVTFGMQLFSGSIHLRCSHFNAFSGFSGDVFDRANFMYNAPALFLRVVEDASNRTFYISADFKNWIQTGQEASNAFITTTKYGFFCRGTGASTINTNCTLLSFTETNP